MTNMIVYLAGALVIIGIGLMGGIVKTHQQDPALRGRFATPASPSRVRTGVVKLL